MHPADRCRGCPPSPTRLSDDPEWGPYLKARSQLVTDLADRVRLDAARRRPAWVGDNLTLTASSLVADVEVWRAANRVDGSDRRATGAPVPNGPGSAWQAQLDQRLAAGTTEGRAALLQLITELAPSTAHDRQAPLVADRLASLVAAGLDGRKLLQQAAAAGPLPDDHPASTLWWRIVDQLPGAASATTATLAPTDASPTSDESRGQGPVAATPAHRLAAAVVTRKMRRHQADSLTGARRDSRTASSRCSTIRTIQEPSRTPRVRTPPPATPAQGARTGPVSHINWRTTVAASPDGGRATRTRRPGQRRVSSLRCGPRRRLLTMEGYTALEDAQSSHARAVANDEFRPLTARLSRRRGTADGVARHHALVSLTLLLHSASIGYLSPRRSAHSTLQSAGSPPDLSSNEAHT